MTSLKIVVLLALLAVASSLTPSTLSAKPLGVLEGKTSSLLLTDEDVSECPNGSKLAIIADRTHTVRDQGRKGCWTLKDEETVLLLWTDPTDGKLVLIQIPAYLFKEPKPDLLV